MDCMWWEGVEKNPILLTVFNELVREVGSMIIHKKQPINASLFK